MIDSEPLPNNIETPFPTETAELMLTGPAGRIETLVGVPDQVPPEAPDAVAIICHGLPETGGRIQGRVTHLIDKSLRQLGLRTVRFSFRGVGDSAGEHDQGTGETEDLLEIVRWVQYHNPNRELWLGGYDFGSYVTARAAQIVDCKHLISVAPTVAKFDYAGLTRPDCHWLIVHGDEDETTPVEMVQDWVNWMAPPAQLIVMQETNHKFKRRLMDLRGVIKNGVKRIERLAEKQQPA